MKEKTGTTDSIDVVVAKIFHPLRLEVPGTVVDDLMQKVDKALRQVERQTLERAEAKVLSEREKRRIRSLMTNNRDSEPIKTQVDPSLPPGEVHFRNERETLERAETAVRNARICDSCQDRAGDAVEALLIRDSDAHDPGCGCNTCYTGGILREEEAPRKLQKCLRYCCKD